MLDVASVVGGVNISLYSAHDCIDTVATLSMRPTYPKKPLVECFSPRIGNLSDNKIVYYYYPISRLCILISVAVLAEISLRSPRIFVIFIIKENIYGIKVSLKINWLLLKKASLILIVLPQVNDKWILENFENLWSWTISNDMVFCKPVSSIFLEDAPNNVYVGIFSSSMGSDVLSKKAGQPRVLGNVIDQCFRFQNIKYIFLDTLIRKKYFFRSSKWISFGVT